jgi:hypothetical protein
LLQAIYGKRVVYDPFDDDDVSYTGYYAVGYDGYDDNDNKPVWTWRRALFILIALLMIIAFLAPYLISIIQTITGGSSSSPPCPAPTLGPLI